MMKRLVFIALALGALLCTGCVKELKYYVVSATAEPSEGGTVTGGGTYLDGATATLGVVPSQGYYFARWSDGNKDNPRTITVKSDANYTAYCYRGDAPAQSDNSVTLNYSSWRHVYVLDDSFLYYSTTMVLQGMLFSISNPTSYYNTPWIRIFLGNMYYGSSSHTYNCGDDGWISDEYSISMIDYCEAAPLINDDTSYFFGEWWCKSIQVDVTSFNFGTHTFTLHLYGTLFDAYDFFVNGTAVNRCATRSIDVELTNVSFEESNDKKSPVAIGHSCRVPPTKVLKK